MAVTQFGHLAYICEDLEASVKFYRDVLGLKQKFVIYYGDWLEHMRKGAAERGETLPAEQDAALEAKKDKVWIAYMEVGEGAFIELFDKGSATTHLVPDNRYFNYSHLSLATDDIFALEKTLRENGAVIDSPPAMGLEHTYQMWSHDPDGNRIEFMQYTPKSWQIVGR